jgi:uncharacterized membrane protein
LLWFPPYQILRLVDIGIPAFRKVTPPPSIVWIAMCSGRRHNTSKTMNLAQELMSYNLNRTLHSDNKARIFLTLLFLILMLTTITQITSKLKATTKFNNNPSIQVAPREQILFTNLSSTSNKELYTKL